ncbi:MAG: Hpt domain-containing protein [Oscillatoriophycideae cyanobacterium NC_groundwater_1537_Pr4_S-0.65um_50_18]|nr:Hpt domain-containing protein [Oscillatoriophycideae cyanobacterium NC_groundwater_1537_Pr4_S-0.65um_50_18]
MIEDDELRNLYKASSEERLQKLEVGLLHLEERPDDEAVLETLRHELHSLKGDSRSLGQADIAAFTEQIEGVVKHIQQREVQLTLGLSNYLYQGVDAIAQLVDEAITGESRQIDLTHISEQLLAAVAAISEPKVPQPEAALPLQPSRPVPTLLEDDELREIYQITSQRRLQNLKLGLVQLSKQSTDATTLEHLRREIHSLKGDSKAVELETVAGLAEQLETLFKAIQRQEIQFNAVLNDRLEQSLEAVAQLVHEAVTGEPSAANIPQVLEGLAQAMLDNSAPQQNPAPETHDASPVASVGEDAELYEIYRTTSEERLQRLEAGLLRLEQQPQNAATLADLLREVHSLKGDSRSAGIDTVETLTHAIEEVLGGIQRREVALTPALGDQLFQGLTAIAQLIQAALTNTPGTINLTQLLSELAQAVPSPIASTEPAIESGVADVMIQDVPSLALSDPQQIDTIRVPTRDLDTLMNQVEELIATRIQIDQSMIQMKQFTTLWDEWKTSRSQGQQVTVPASNAYEGQLETLIDRLRRSAQESSTKLDFITETLGDRIRTLRMLPLASLFQSFARVVRDLGRQQSKEVQLIIEGGDITADKRILEEMKDALMHLIRNSIDHGIEASDDRAKLGKPRLATIWLRGYQTSNSIVIEVADDGRGLNLEHIKQTAIKRRLYSPQELEAMAPIQLYDLIFAPGFSTRTFITELSGRGVGLDVVRTKVDRLKGTIQVNSTPNQGCTFRLQLSTNLTTANVMLLEVHGIIHALPIEFLQTSLLISPDDIVTVDGQDTLTIDGQDIRIAQLADVLELSSSPAYATVAKVNPQHSDRQPCLLLRVGEEVGGFLVDRLLTMQEVILKPQSPLLKRVRNVMGATILGTGDVCMILNPVDLLKSLQRSTSLASAIDLRTITQRKRVILLVEDSPPVRIQEKRLFESAGYEVVIAIDGLDGYKQLRSHTVDAVVSDVEMPNLDGLSLTTKIRQHAEYAQLPIILVTTLSGDEDRSRGAAAGADAYIIKGKFNQEVLLETLERLI